MNDPLTGIPIHASDGMTLGKIAFAFDHPLHDTFPDGVTPDEYFKWLQKQLPPSTICEETCQTCKRDFNPSLVESGECIFCIAKAHREQAEKAKAACAEMRALVGPIDLLYACPCESCNKLRHALSSDCGKGWLAPEKVQKLLGLIDGAKIAVELFPASPSQVQWRKRWLEDAKQALEEAK